MDEELLVIICAAVAIFTAMGFWAKYLAKETCLTRYADFQPEFHGMIKGCMVQYNGKTVPIEVVRVIE